MKNVKANVLVGVGLIINAIAIIVNHFFINLPHIVYFSILIIGIIFMIFGVIETRKVINKNK